MTEPLRAKQQGRDAENGQSIRLLHEQLLRSAWKDVKGGRSWALCLCALASAFEPRCRRHRIVSAMPYGERRIDKAYVLEAMANLGYPATAISLSPSALDPRLRPALFVPRARPDRPCILLPGDTIFDSETGRTSPMPAKLPAGDIILFKAYSEEADPASKDSRANTGLPWFRALFKRFHPLILRVLAIGLFLNLMATATPLFIMMVYDRVISTNTPSVLPMLAVGGMGFIVLEWALRALRSRHLCWLAARLDNIVNNKVFSQFSHMPPSLLDSAPVPSQIARLKAYESVRDFFSSPVFLSMVELPFTVLTLVALGAIAGPLVLVPVAAAAIYMGLLYFVWRHVRVAIKLSAKAASARQRYAIDTLTKLEDIRAGGLSDIWRRKFADVSGREAAAQIRLNWLGLVGETGANAITVLSAVCIVGFGVQMVWDGSISTGALVASMILVWRVLNPFYSLCTMVPRLEQLRNSIRQINQLMDFNTEERTGRGLSKPSELRGQVSFVNVGMRYGSGDEVFSGLGFQAEPGQRIIVTGENGAGKTTLLKLAKGLYAPSSGHVRIDGIDMRQLDPVEIRRQIAYVPQHSHFFSGSIEDNLRFANPFSTRVEMEAMLDKAGAMDDVRRLPQGLDSVIGGEHGIRPSPGLALKLSLARAALQGSRILLIDEIPNAQMDEAAMKFLTRELMGGGRTVVMVTYRVDMLRIADRIVWLRLGEPPLSGERDMMLQHLKHGNW